MSRMLRQAIPLSVSAALSISAAAGATLVPELEIPLAKHMRLVCDLSADGAGNLYVLGGTGFSGAEYKVYRFSPDGQLVGTFGEGRFSAPLRLTTTRSGRVIVADFCRLQVFAPSGSFERMVELSRCDPIHALEMLERETVGVLTVKNEGGFHPQLYRVDVASGNASPPVPDVVSMAGAPSEVIQKTLEASNRHPDIYLASVSSSGWLVAGYSRTNRLVAMTSSGAVAHTISLAPFSPNPLPSAALAEEEYVQSVQRAAGRSYAKEQDEGSYNGLVADPAGRVVVTGRGKNQDGQYLSEVYDLSGRQVDTIRSPYELNRTLAFEQAKAFCICDRGTNDWTLVRFGVR